jgi:hypothetical protein
MISGLITVFRMTLFSHGGVGLSATSVEVFLTPLRGIFDTAVRQPRKLEVENLGLGIYLPLPRHVLADWRAGVLRLVKY